MKDGKDTPKNKSAAKIPSPGGNYTGKNKKSEGEDIDENNAEGDTDDLNLNKEDEKNAKVENDS